MFDLALLVTKVINDTGYMTKLSDGKEPTGMNKTAPPQITIGYHSVEASAVLGDGDYISPMAAYAESLKQFIYVQINCDIAVFPSVWRTVHDCISGWTPLPSEANYSGIVPNRQLSKNVADGRITWLQYYSIDMPNVTQSIT